MILISCPWCQGMLDTTWWLSQMQNCSCCLLKVSLSSLKGASHLDALIAWTYPCLLLGLKKLWNLGWYSPLREWWGPGIGCPEKLWLSHLWKCSNPAWMRLWAIWDSEKCPWPWQEGWNSVIFKVPSNQNILLWLNYPQILPHLTQVSRKPAVLPAPLLMRGLGKRQRHRAKPETCSLLPWKTRARCQGQSWEWQPLPSEAAWISIFPRRVSVSNSSERERIPAGEIPADNLLIPQPNLKVTTQKKKIHFHVVFSCLCSPSRHNPHHWHLCMKRGWLCLSKHHQIFGLILQRCCLSWILHFWLYLGSCLWSQECWETQIV